jgi:hypothetical protein
MVPFLAVLVAASTMNPSVGRTDPSIEDRIHDLESDVANKRKLAALTLRRLTRQYTRVADREHGDEIPIMEARQALMVFDEELARTCIERLAVPNLTGPCADILGLLGTSEAATPLEQQLQREERRSVQRRIEKALTAIQAP